MSIINMAAVFKLADKTSGRDKLCRLVQYGSKFISWVLEQEGVAPVLVKKLRELEPSISTARKLFRLGKSVDSFRSALQTIHLVDPVLRLLVTLARINRGIYLLFDHFIWAVRMRLFTANMEYWNKHANRFWLLAVALGLLRDLYEVVLAIQVERKRLKQHSSGGNTQTRGRILANVVENNSALLVDVVKNGADLLIPVSRLDVVYLPSGVVGLLGVLSSLAGLLATYNDHYKLKFS